jgi:GMP synthase-like glutamine amidotransferase
MILIIKTNKEKLHDYEFVKPVEDILRRNKLRFFTKMYSKITKKDLDKSKKIIICGTSIKDFDYIKNLNKFYWIKNFNKPLLGICAGMQVIGLIYGWKIFSSKSIGLIKVIIQNEILGFKDQKEVYMLHSSKLKPNRISGELLKIHSINKKGSPIGLKVVNKEIYGVLFHPEVRNKDLIKNFIIN